MNQNYTDTTTSQNSMMLSTIANAQKSGDPINTVSVQLGANDLFAATATPGFFSMTAAQQTGLVEQAIETAATNVASILKEIKADLPNANVLVMGYYNPYAAVPSNPLSAVAAPAVQGLDAGLKAVADAIGDRYVDTYTPFLGNEAQYTYIASSGTQYNVHPNDQGYQVIANQMEGPSLDPHGARRRCRRPAGDPKAVGANRFGGKKKKKRTHFGAVVKPAPANRRSRGSSRDVLEPPPGRRSP